MKALTDKIIERQQALINDIIGPRSEYGKGMQQVINNIKYEESQADFEEIARVMMKYLAKNHHPHTKVIVESNRAEMVEGVKCCNTDEYLID